MDLKSAKFPGRIRNRLIVLFLIPTLLLLAASGWYYYRLAKSALEKEMGLRLETLAAGASEMISVESIINFSPDRNDESSRAYKIAQSRLKQLMKQADADHIYVFDKNYRSLLDTGTEFPIGKKYVRLDADSWEIDQVIEGGSTASSTMFVGHDGNFYKAGYAPLVLDNKVVAVLGVDAGVKFFDVLKSVARNMFIMAFAGAAIIIFVSLFVARGIERPVGRLVSSAKLIGTGELDHKIVPTTRDEIGFLAQTLNEMRQNIVERDRYLQMLQRGIAHEVRNPLGGMRLFCDILTEELAGQDDKIQRVTKIKQEVDGLNKVVNDFLDFTREVSPDIREVEVEPFIADILMHYATTTEGSMVAIKKNLDPELQTAWMDPELVRRVLFNLINNGIQAMADGGTLTLGAQLNDGVMALSVSDTGQGIPPKDLENIFTPFFTTKDKGTGLGLPFAKKIAENHSGKIDIKSEPGSGTTVTMEIPMDRKET